MVISSPSLRERVSASVKSAVCSRSLSVNISVVSIIPSVDTLAVTIASLSVEIPSLASSISSSTSARVVTSVETSTFSESLVELLLPQAANDIVIMIETMIALTLFLILLFLITFPSYSVSILSILLPRLISRLPFLVLSSSRKSLLEIFGFITTLSVIL